MDNFSIFNKANVATAIEPFLPGAADYITPIAYRAWTPDIFLFLFQTTTQDGKELFSCLLPMTIYLRQSMKWRKSYSNGTILGQSSSLPPKSLVIRQMR